MPDSPGTIELIGREVGQPLQRLAGLLGHNEVLETLANFGVAFPPQLLANAGFENARQASSDAANGLAPLLSDLGAAIDADDSGRMIEKGLQLFGQVAEIIASFTTLRNAIQAAQPTLPGITPQQVNDLTADFPRKLLNLLLVTQLDTVPAVGATLTVLGLIEREFQAGDPANPTKPAFEVSHLRPERLGPLLSSPGDYLQDLYGWGTAGFNGETLFQVLASVVTSLGLPARYVPPAGGVPAKLEAFAIDLTVDTSVNPPGLIVDFQMPMAATVERTINLPHPAWRLRLRGSAELEIGATANVAPPLEISIRPPQGSLAGQVEVILQGAPQSPFILIGQTGGSRLEVGSVSVGALLRLEWNSATNQATLIPGVSGSLSSGKLLVDTSNSDGFIATLLSGFKLESNFDVGLAWNMRDGVQFQGSATLEIAIPTHLSLGPLEIQALYLITRLGPPPIPIELAADMRAQLGPLTAVVSRIGAGIDLSFPANGGNAGPAQIDFRFKPPNGVGLAVDAGVVKGGGFLYIDTDRGEYAGALELTFSNFLSLKAIGIITTRMPDGSSGFSLLIIITAEFGTGLQLGYGFTLLAVGGLLGLNRTMALQPLMEGVRTGAINSVMFPQNVVANAPRIISDLRLLFPPRTGTFLIGPMAKLGWGTPTLISVALGIIIEIPGNIAILGVLRVALPTADAPLVNLQVNFAGAIEFDRKRLYFFAALFESRIVFLTIEGEMGLLVAFGDDANFVVSVGGFHPRYSPPPLPFPSPRRIRVSLIDTSFARVFIEGYFAITSNSVQFGARAELFFGFDALNVQGHLAFDALFQFSPFYFIIEISASFSVTVFGAGLFSVRLAGSLEGPTPWRARGEASLSILFFEISVDVDATWGESAETQLPPITVMPLLQAEFDKNENWRALPPATNNLLVSLRKMEEAEAALLLHPVGTLRVAQRALPLNLTLDKVGNQKPSDVNKLAVAVTGGGLAKKADASELFAPAQFQNFSDGDKLSKPAFAPQAAGLELAPAGAELRSSFMARRTVRYEEIIIDNNFKRFVRRFFGFNGFLFGFFLGGSTVTRSELSMASRKRLNPFTDQVTVATEGYTVAFQSNNRAHDDVATSFSSEASAREHLNQIVAQDPNMAERLHVIPAFERAA
ncbi:MAG TPA: DUF6603 domain-containing protein [Pyrinomonadaceae bacterium]|nr:DUF6603 domain-containing protein [Pyrinomonadaceae bacterium]